jgi:hypothetical protein
MSTSTTQPAIQSASAAADIMQQRASILAQRDAAAGDQISSNDSAQIHDLQGRSSELSARMAEGKVDMINNHLQSVESQLNPPPTKEVPTGGKSGGMKTVVDEKEKSRLESDKAATESKLAAAEGDASVARQEAAQHEQRAGEQEQVSSTAGSTQEALNSQAADLSNQLSNQQAADANNSNTTVAVNSNDSSTDRDSASSDERRNNSNQTSGAASTVAASTARNDSPALT